MNSWEGLQIGWATADLTPGKPVLLWGQFHCRVSEDVKDPLTATALALESTSGTVTTGVVMVSCDLVAIPQSLLDAVRANVSKSLPDLDPLCVYLNATHTHTGPELGLDSDLKLSGGGMSNSGMKIDLPVMAVAACVEFVAGRIAEAVKSAWKNRQSGSIGYGVGQAVVGRNRRSCYQGGVTHMYGNTRDPGFSHIEGYEDHAVNLLATWDADDQLAGLVVNVACPSQVSESEFTISADFWHDTRLELRRRFGDKLFVLGQCSAAGDQSPHIQFNKAAEERMSRLAGRTQRQEIAVRIADAVTTTLPLMSKERVKNPTLTHRVETVELLRRKLSEADVQEALAAAAPSRAKYEELLRDLEAHPERRQEPRWYVELTEGYRRMSWNMGVHKRYELERTQPRIPAEVHVLRLGDVVFASNPFEYYLDFGVCIKARSPAIQTFLVQLTGPVATYVPTERAIAGKSYGAVPASTLVGPEGGRELVEWTVKTIEEMFRK